jgi:hypothetical protein
VEWGPGKKAGRTLDDVVFEFVLLPFLRLFCLAATSGGEEGTPVKATRWPRDPRLVAFAEDFLALLPLCCCGCYPTCVVRPHQLPQTSIHSLTHLQHKWKPEGFSRASSLQKEANCRSTCHHPHFPTSMRTSSTLLVSHPPSAADSSDLPSTSDSAMASKTDSS